MISQLKSKISGSVANARFEYLKRDIYPGSELLSIAPDCVASTSCFLLPCLTRSSFALGKLHPTRGPPSYWANATCGQHLGFRCQLTRQMRLTDNVAMGTVRKGTLSALLEIPIKVPPPSVGRPSCLASPLSLPLHNSLSPPAAVRSERASERADGRPTARPPHQNKTTARQ